MEDFKKISTLHKWYLKYANRQAYNNYKDLLRKHNNRMRRVELQNEMDQLLAEREGERGMQDDKQYALMTSKINHPSINHAYKQDTTFKHSGNSGDIIYALPTVYALSKNGNAHLLLQPGQKLFVDGYHPLGDVMLNDKMIEMLKPLLLHQPQITSVNRYESQQVDYDLDLFRQYPMPLEKLCISRWYFYVYGAFADLSKPWLIAPKDDSYADYIVIARSHRYRAPNIDYSFLDKYPNKLFVGVPEEYEDTRKLVPSIKYKPVNDFLELAIIINSCKLFIGNQSFPFSIAEALKVNRVVELYYKTPNVMVQGPGGHDFLYQKQFEKIVAELCSNPGIAATNSASC